MYHFICRPNLFAGTIDEWSYNTAESGGKRDLFVADEHKKVINNQKNGYSDYASRFMLQQFVGETCCNPSFVKWCQPGSGFTLA